MCFDCAQGFHFDCYSTVDGNCCCGGLNDGRETSEQSGEKLSTGLRDGLVWAKADAQIRDIKSTGRKRAAKLYPIDVHGDCEWRSLLFAGGGITPIIGCSSGTMKHRHHGPIMLTTVNIEGNVHRICDPCHRVWHVCNDAYAKDFIQTVLWVPHDPFTQAPVEILKLAGVSEKIRIDMSFERRDKRTYRKAEHDYRELLDSLQERAEVVNPWLGI